MSLSYTSILAGASGQSSGYSIPYSARFVSGNSAYLTRTPGVAPALRQGTISFWFKLGALGTTRTLFSQWNTTTSTWNILVRLETGDTLSASFENNVGANIIKRATTQVLRDVGAWYHCVISWNSGLTTNSSCTVSLNGSAVSAFTTTTNPGAATDLGFNTNALQIGRGNTTNYFDGYLSNFYYVDGSVVAASSFGQTNTSGVWVPKAYTGTFGTNGFLMAFANSAALGTDTSGNGNTFTSSGLTAADQFSDTPTLNYPVLNPLNNQNAATITSGNLTYTLPGAGTGYSSVVGTAGVTSGKWYWEVKNTSAIDVIIGIADSSFNNMTATPALSSVPHYGYRKSTGNISTSGSTDPGIAYGATYTTNDFIGVALDLDSGTKTITFYKNNTTQGAYTISETGKVWFPTSSRYDNNPTGIFNFGASAFNYTPPTGYVALNTTNLPVPAIKDGSAHFQTTLYTGTGSSLAVDQSGNSTFTPGFVWTKSRSAVASHRVWDVLRGATTALFTNTTGADFTESGLTSFDADGFTVGTDGGINTNAATYVGWQWKANGAGVSNTSGSITSSVSANTTAGFSVVTYTGNGTAGATIGHGLGVAPKMIIVKQRSSAGNNWPVYHTSLGATKYIELNTTIAAATATNRWNDTTPGSSVFTVGDTTAINSNGQTYVAYCFAEVAGFSAMGSYTGNGSADGPFIYTGFTPAFLLIKRTDTTGNWRLIDTARDPYNGDTANILYPDLSAAEDIGGVHDDWLSNGFKPRQSSAVNNASGGTYVYAAFASNPFGGSGAAPATAR